MARDYASTRSKTPRKRRPTRRRKNSKPAPLFHGGSFFAGMLIGIGATTAGMLLPGWWEASAIGERVPTDRSAERQETPAETRFEFWDVLPGDGIGSNPEVYRGAAPGAADEPVEFLVQAGSFPTSEDADRMRASLLLLGLDVATRSVTLDNGAVWHRVLVGPFDTERDTRRAMTRLREQNIDPLLLKRRPGAT